MKKLLFLLFLLFLSFFLPLGYGCNRPSPYDDHVREIEVGGGDGEIDIIESPMSQKTIIVATYKGKVTNTDTFSYIQKLDTSHFAPNKF